MVQQWLQTLGLSGEKHPAATPTRADASPASSWLDRLAPRPSADGETRLIPMTQAELDDASNWLAGGRSRGWHRTR